MNTKALRGIQYFWTLFIGLGAVGGAVMMLVDPTGKAMGMDKMLPCFQVLPFAEVLFQNFVFPGIALLIVNGLTQLFTFWLLIRRKRGAAACSVACGVLLMLWITIQFFIFEFNMLSTSYFVFGALEALTGVGLLLGEGRA